MMSFMAIEQALLWLFTKTESPELSFSCCLSLTQAVIFTIKFKTKFFFQQRLASLKYISF